MTVYSITVQAVHNNMLKLSFNTKIEPAYIKIKENLNMMKAVHTIKLTLESKKHIFL